MRDDFFEWLQRQGHTENSCRSRLSWVRGLEAAYGDLDQLLANGDFDEMVNELTYSSDDSRTGRPNPSRLIFEGDIYKRLANFKVAARQYRRFVESEADDLEPPSTAAPDKQRLALERDMQAALRRDIAALDPGLTIIDNGSERQVPSGRIDILCQDASGARVVLELKAGESRPDVIAQTLGYMGDLMDEDPGASVRGIIIAQEFDSRTTAAARAIPNLDLVTYGISFHFAKVAQ